MKKGVGIAAIVVVLLGAAPFGFGYWAEQRVRILLDELEASGAVDFTVLKTERGWFSSSLDVMAEVSGDLASAYANYQQRAGAGSPSALSCTFRNRIHHGPIAFSGLSGDLTALVPSVGIVESSLVTCGSSSIAAEEAGSVVTRLALTGGGRSLVSVPARSISANNEQAGLEWHGLTGSIAFGAHLSRMQAQFNAPRLDIVDAKTKLSIADIDLRMDTQEGIEGLSLGDFSFRIGEVNVEPVAAESGPHVRVESTSLEGSSKASGATISTSARLEAKAIQVDDVQFGPAVYAISLRNLDAKAIAKIDRAIKDLKKQNLPQQQVAMMMGGTLLGVLPQLLEKGPIMEIGEVSLDSQDGKLQGRAMLTVDTSNPMVLSNPLLLKEALIGNVELEVPQALLIAMSKLSLEKQLATLDLQYSEEQVEAMARERVEKAMAEPRMRAFLVPDGDSYRFAASIEGGQVTVNGRAFEPSLLPQNSAQGTPQ